MTPRAAFNLHIFRDGRREIKGPALLDGLARELGAISGAGSSARRPERLLSALLRAGELECILADQRDKSARRMAAITDAIAGALLPDAGRPRPEILGALSGIEVPARVLGRPPEGFAYYALHPLDYADIIDDLPLRSSWVCVLGLRSIGTTLSAVVTAALGRRGIAAARITARPEGHPYAREVHFVDDEIRWIQQGLDVEAEFLVVDEGPGLSGSSFIAAGEALVAAGVPLDRITFLSSRAPDPKSLLAKDAARRFGAFRIRAVKAATRLPSDIGASLGGGGWRAVLEPDPERWPATWVTLERLKFLSSDGRRLLKFDGLGRYGEEVQRRAERLHREGFGPKPCDEGGGFVSYPFLPGPLCSAADLGQAEIHRLAAYVALRASAFSAPSAECAELDAMVRHNCEVALGRQLGASFTLPIERPVIVDGRMMPHEWRRTTNGELLKMDGVTHGDDHFFPGPTDVAWDIAGAIVEWRMSPGARRAFLDVYGRLSGDRPEARLPPYLFAYALFRLACAKMTASALAGGDEEARAAADQRRYRAFLQAEGMIPRSSVA